MVFVNAQRPGVTQPAIFDQLSPFFQVEFTYCLLSAKRYGQELYCLENAFLAVLMSWNSLWVSCFQIGNCSLFQKKVGVAEFHLQRTSYHEKQKIILSLVNSSAATNDPAGSRPRMQVYTRRPKPINAPISEFGDNLEYFFPSPLAWEKQCAPWQKRNHRMCRMSTRSWCLIPTSFTGSELGTYCPED